MFGFIDELLWVMFGIPKIKGKQYYIDKLKEIDEEYINDNTPLEWYPGMPVNNFTQNLWIKRTQEMRAKYPTYYKVLDEMAPKKTGTLKNRFI